MKYIKLFFILVIVCALNGCDQQSTKHEELVMSIDMVRHGDRGPLAWYPKIVDAWTKEEIGQLTKKGEKESKELGKEFKNYYINNLKFLPATASQEIIYVRSTSFQRTKATAKSILEGMFEDSSENLHIDIKEKKDDPCFALFYKYKKGVFIKR